ncbi:MAG: LPS export ABC transporter permease LptG [Candidatus Binatia bacterium]
MRFHFKFLPLGSILDRYIAAGFLRIFFVSLAVITSLYFTVDFFDRIGSLMEAGASISSIARYFFYKAPLLISRTIGFATLFSTLFCLGTLARSREIVAIRSSGISIERVALPLMLLGLLICAFTFVWNETLVPVFTRNSQNIYKYEIKNRQQKSLLGTQDIWIRGDASFINVDYFDTRTAALENVTVFLLNRDFSLRALVEIPRAEWTNDGWKTEEATEWNFLPDGQTFRQKVTAALPIRETPEDLKLLARDAEEFSYFELRKQIADMRSKGIDTTGYEVDLQIKLALPFVAPLMVFLAIPFALKRHRGGSVSLSFGIAMVIGFGYWVLTAFCISLGHSGALPSWISAWIPNFIFAMVSLFFFTAEE